MSVKPLLIILLICVISGCNSPTETSVVEPWVTIVPLEAKIIMRVEETSDRIALKLRTENEYGTSDNLIHLTGGKINAHTYHFVIEGVELCVGCNEEVGPAGQEVFLEKLNGKYALSFDYLDESQNYRLEITDSQLLLEPTNRSSFIEAKYLEWQRLPAKTIWFAVGRGWVYDEYGNLAMLEHAPYTEISGQFYDRVESLGAIPYHPAEGHYTNYLFIPPWESWFERKNEDDSRTRIPLEIEDSFLELDWPDIRYFSYQGDWDKIENTVRDYADLGLTIYGYSNMGHKILVDSNWHDN